MDFVLRVLEEVKLDLENKLTRHEVCKQDEKCFVSNGQYGFQSVLDEDLKRLEEVKQAIKMMKENMR